MAEIRLEGVAVSYGGVAAVRGVDLIVKHGELVTLLGASGSGKTTLLRLIAGFVECGQGTVSIGGRPMRNVPPYRRNVGIVFQNYGLFPHMAVRDNVAFGLRMRRLPARAVQERVERALALVGLQGLGHRHPRQLSGGQQQRVALARALVIEPEVLLLDEPFGALDRKLRDQMQAELKRLQRRLGITTVFVTHDQEEALRLADRVALIADGRVVQVADPVTIYEAPATASVAQFIGAANVLPGTIRAARGGETEIALGSDLVCLTRRVEGDPPVGARVTVVVRPEKIVLGRETPAIGANALPGVVDEVTYVGSATQYLVRLASGLQMTVAVQNSAQAVTSPVEPGDEVVLHLPPQHLRVFPAGS